MTFQQSSRFAGDYPEAGLTKREVEVLLAWLRSDTKAQVAAELFITPATINTHLVRIRDKYEAAGRPAGTKAALVARALQDGLIELDEL
ncbi:MAG TPA: LuxR C-terminal-related transcriptional regulator [Nocardia sp.]|uniref:response regulator transcription factor n=1 Tax=Nocardia TaxID=1817 RepID=UPI0024560A49|nr:MULTISPECIES: LuxR C-terminal-related transcriptional regulator [Nocardia]HLS78776.1 LuxR C-terminal-related transcriptional regulator [Nocardia sp.]